MDAVDTADAVGDDATGAVAERVSRVASVLSAAAGDARATAEAVAACADVVHACDADPGSAAAAYAALGRLLATAPNRAAAGAVFECLQARGLAAGAPAALYDALLQVRERPLRLRAVTALGLAVEQGLSPAPLLGRLAAALADCAAPPPALGAILHCASGGDVPRLLAPDASPAARALAAAWLDAAGAAPPDAARRVIALGAAAAERLGYLLEFTRATHRDLVWVSGEDGAVPLLACIEEAVQALGAERLARAIAELGWPRVCMGIEVQALTSLRIGGGFPVQVAPAEAALLELAGAVEHAGEAHLIVAHGRIDATDAPLGGASQAQRIRRFREYNIVHAELLNEILEVAPITAGRARAMLAGVLRLADDFAWLFAGHDDEAARAPAVAAAVVARAAAALPPDDATLLDPAATRRLQAFEDPSDLGHVTTVHGLKRYLHQRGLRNAFRLFQSGAAANRTVDLALVDGSGATSVVRRIRYIEFEPPHEAQPVPAVVRMVVAAFGRWLAQGMTQLPDARLLIYAHEVQLYLTYRAHPAFVRMDLSPPRRGGMIDLEYFAVSQYELTEHPARHLAGIQALLRRLGFFVTLDGLRIHARYDKERAFDRADILEKAEALLRAAPLLMDFDWAIGSLLYPADAQKLVQSAWIDFFEREGVLPIDRLLTADRCRIARDTASPREEAWDGTGAYSGRFAGSAGPGWWASLQAVLEARGLGDIVQAGAASTPPGQLALERRLLAPLRAALGEGAAVVEGGVPARAGPDRYREEHEAVRLAALLRAGGAALDDAARLGAVVRNASTLFRFHTTGTVNGYSVQRADLVLSAGPVALFVLCDAHSTIQLARAVAGSRPALLRDDATGEWRWRGDLAAAALLEQLLRDNYIAALPLLAPLHIAPAASLLAHFATPALRPRRAALPGDCVVEAEPAAPGRAAGPIRFVTAAPAMAATAAAVDGCVLAAPVIRPEDAQLLRPAAAVVTTGGGILSHAALVALELRKPSVLLRGTWHGETAGTHTLRLTRTEYTERHERTGSYDVVCWDVVRRHEHEVRNGDLVAVDADEGVIRLLGQERQALALHNGLADLELEARRLAAATDDAHVLELRGRLLRTMHGLRRLMAELAEPVLAHHCARQLLAAQSDPAAPAIAERRELLRLLLANPAVGAAAGAAAAAAVGEMLARFRSLAEQARSTIPLLAAPLPILFLRLALVRLAAGLRSLEAVCGDAVPADEVADAAAHVDALSVARLVELRRGLARRLGGAAAAEPAGQAHVLAQLAAIDAVLAPTGRPTALTAIANPDGAADGRTDRWIVTHADAEPALAAVAGPKAAGLAFIAQVIGGAAVPGWFAVTHAAFRAVLAQPAPGTGTAAGLPVGCTLDGAIDAVLTRPGLDPRARATAIAELWRQAVLPAALEDAIRDAYRQLDNAGTAAGAAPVAVRSSCFEEDAPDAAGAGQFSTFLNVSGADSVLEHVRRVWAGLWSERAIARRGGSAGPAGGGVIVQRMVRARAAGVLHTVSVATAELRTMVANVGLGLGAGVVSGEVGVDEIRVTRPAGGAAPDVQYDVGDKHEQIVSDIVAGSGTVRVETSYHQRFRAALEYAEVLELTTAGAALEAALGAPLDIEFAFEGDRLLLLQVRPIPVFHHALTETLRRFPIRAVP